MSEVENRRVGCARVPLRNDPRRPDKTEPMVWVRLDDRVFYWFRGRWTAGNPLAGTMKPKSPDTRPEGT